MEEANAFTGGLEKETTSTCLLYELGGRPFSSNGRSTACAAMLLLCALTSSVAAAGRYELVKGEGVEVCEEYGKSLNSFEPKVPMVCGRPVSSRLGFSKPEWQPSEPPMRTPNGMPIGKIFDDFGEYLWERDVNPVTKLSRDKWPQWKGTSAQYSEAHRHYLVERERIWRDLPPLIADFDIDNHGKTEHIYFEHPCGSVYGDLFAVLTPDYSAVDRKRTEQILPHPSFRKMIASAGLGVFQPVKKGDWGGGGFLDLGYMPVADAFGNLHYDFFFFKEKTYFDQWWRRHPNFGGRSDVEAGLLRVYKASQSGTEELCAYRFHY